MSRTAAAHCVTARAVVRHPSAIPMSVAVITGSGSAVPPCSAGTNPRSTPPEASAAKLPLRQGPSTAVRSANRATAASGSSERSGVGGSERGESIP